MSELWLFILNIALQSWKCLRDLGAFEGRRVMIFTTLIVSADWHSVIMFSSDQVPLGKGGRCRTILSMCYTSHLLSFGVGLLTLLRWLRCIWALLYGRNLSQLILRNRTGSSQLWAQPAVLLINQGALVDQNLLGGGMWLGPSSG